MTTNGLARHYGALTPDERLPLIMAASRRGHEAERQRLIDSAPHSLYKMADCYGRMDTFQTLTLLYWCELLETAGLYLQCCYIADSDRFDLAERVGAVGSLYGYLYRVRREGWRSFCEGLHLPPDLYADRLPGRDLLDVADRFAETWAFTPEEALAHVWTKHGPDLVLLTEEGVADRWREAYRAAYRQWDRDED
jgi:hypothetical protein